MDVIGLLALGLLALPAADTETPTSGTTHWTSRPRLTGEWRGHRTELERQGWFFSMYANTQSGIQARGGVNPGNHRRHSGSFDLFVRADLGRMGLVRDAEVLMQAKSNVGRNVNPTVGAISEPFDDADFDELLYIDQLWYQQRFQSGHRLRAGYLDQQTILDRNAFANSEDVQFMSLALDNNPVIPLKIGWGASTWLQLSARFQLILGIADADGEIREAHLDTAFGDTDNIALFSEANIPMAWGDDERSGRVRVGLFYDPRKKTVFTAPADPSRSERGHLGAYVSADQVLWRGDNNDKQVGAFLRLGLADENVNKVETFSSTGLELRGMLPRSTVLGVALWNIDVSSRYESEIDPAADRETGVEAYARIPVLPWLAVTPDVQYIDNPSGSTDVADAWVFGLRLRFTL